MMEIERSQRLKNGQREIDLNKMQRKYLIGGFFLSPLLPFLYFQGQFVRLKIGRLPDAEGENTGEIGEGEETLNLLTIGESTIAGIGAKNHKEAFTGQFAKHLSNRIGKKVKWNAFGVSGITVRRTIREIIPNTPSRQMDVIVLALGANDVFQVNSPKKWHRDISELIYILREKYPSAEMFLANVPMIRDFLALPNPLRYILSRLAKIQHFSTIDLVSKMKKVNYFEDVSKVDDEFFCKDGVHPSPKGYDLWSEALVKSFIEKTQFVEMPATPKND